MKALKKIVLLDVHAILHRAYHALPGFASSKGEPTGALYGLSAFLIKIIGDLHPDYLIACYDLPGPTFRKKVYEDYKAGRAKADPELVSQMIRSKDVFKAFNIPIYEKPGFEADDIIGTIAEHTKKDKDLKTIIASGDMDTMQLVSGDTVVVYTLKKGINDTVVYNEEMVKERFGFGPEFLTDYKGLRGDPSDNIIGVKGIGEKTGTDLIKNFGSIEDLYKVLNKDPKMLLKAGIKQRIVDILKEGQEEAEFSKMLATIKRDVPIEFSLPDKSWQEGLDMPATLKFFQELEFRTLGPRLQSVLSNQVVGLPAHGQEGNSRPNQPPGSQSNQTNPVPVSPEEFRKLAIATWLLNSDLTKITTEDILQISGAKDISEAAIKLPELIKKNGLEKVYNDIELPIMPIIKEAEDRGILLDTEHLKKLSQEYHKKLEALEAKIWEMARLPSPAGEANGGQAVGEFNINSSKQLAVVLFDKMMLTAKGLKKTAGGARSTRESELLKLQGTNPIIDEILSYREIQKLLSTYIDPLPTMVDDKSRLHTSLDQMGTTTGRLSSRDPNLQNIPAGGDMAKEIRRAFVATPGYKFVALDYSQIEMRVLAWLSGDSELIKIFKEGKDIHSAVASKVFGVPEDEVSKEMRRKAKVINFGIVYGMGVSSLRKNLNSTMEEAQTFYNNFFLQFPKIRDYFEKVKNEARKKGFTTTAYGRRRYFPMINSSLPFVRAEAERMAVNAPIQGTATADLIKIAMKKADTKLREAGLHDSVYLLLQVHDELLYEIKDDKNLKKTVDVIKEAMEKVDDLPIPISVNSYVGDNWGDIK
ncbi:MAG: DNA polymerase [bacterium]|nr:DNA polymerase [bacterium]